MLEYLPWSKSEFDEALKLLKRGIFSSLDIEMGGDCPYSCIYCETPYRTKASAVNYTKIEEFIHTGMIKWIYICGIGEPSYGRNSVLLKKLLKSCAENDVKCSIFTNLSNLTDDIIEYVQNGTLYLIIKFDSQNPDVINAVYHPDDIDKHLNAVERAFNLVKIKSGKTNIAASIVPTQENLNEIVSLVNYCMSKSVFPLIGQLEYSGSAKNIFSELALDNDVLTNLKLKVEEELGEEYTIPFCPAVFAGYHIKIDNNVTVDYRTGLSCHFFWLDEPLVENVIELKNDVYFEEIGRKILSLRRAKFPSLGRFNAIENVFGGCGGNIKEIFNIYSFIMEGGVIDG